MNKNYLLIVEKVIEGKLQQEVFWYSTEEEILKEIEEIKTLIKLCNSKTRFDAYEINTKREYQIDGFKTI